MDRRTYTALALCMLFFLAFQMLRPRAPIEPVIGEVPPAEQPQSVPSSTAPQATVQSPVLVELNENIRVETDLFAARFSNRGAVLLELHSKRFFTEPRFSEAQKGDPSNWLPFILDMDPSARSLLWTVHSSSQGGPDIQSAHWSLEGPLFRDGFTELLFHHRTADGFRFEKSFRFKEGSHEILVDLSLTRDESETERRGTLSCSLVSAANLRGDRTAQYALPPSAVVAFGSDPDFDSFSAKELKDEHRDVVTDNERRRVRFFGTESNYFAVVLAPLDSTSREAVTSVRCNAVLDQPALEESLQQYRNEHGGAITASKEESLREAHENNARATALLRMVIPDDPQTTRLSYRLYAGPKSGLVMADETYADYRSLYEKDYGRMAWINEALLWILRQFHRLTGNWGFAIILLTLLVKILLFPLNRAQSRTMEDFQKKMARLKPELDAIKEKHKNNLRKFGEEQRRLMQQHQVRTPFFGCLIIFAQLPVFFGLFQILRSSFDLRHQPFFGWMRDLSQPDACPLPFSVFGLQSLNVLPILMVIAMVWNTRMMPKSQDPQAAQMRSMMMIMNFVFGIFLYGYAAGLSLYMLTNALLGIAQFKLLRTTSAT